MEETSDAVEIWSVAIGVDLDLPFILGGLELSECICIDVPVSVNEVVLDNLGSELVSTIGKFLLSAPVAAFPADL